MVEPAKARINTMIARAVVEAVNDGKMMQAVKVSGLIDVDHVEHFQPGGVSHNPGAGAEGLLFRIGGNHYVLLAASKRGKRPKSLDSGDTAVWNEHGVVIKLTGPNTIEVTGLTPGGLTVTLSGDIELPSGVTLATHVHPTPMGPTGPSAPGGP